MMQEFRTIRDEAIRVDFNAIVEHFPAGLRESPVERLNRAAQWAGFGHPFSESDSIDVTRQKLGSMMDNEVFKMGFCEAFGRDLTLIQQEIERRTASAKPGAIGTMMATAASYLRVPLFRFTPTS
jgi:hypothetical protein